MDSPKRYLLYEKLSKIIPVIDKIKDADLPFPLSFPRIVVIGQSSVGKSSVVEALIGIDFLPKGQVINTLRCIYNHRIGDSHEKSHRDSND